MKTENELQESKNTETKKTFLTENSIDQLKSLFKDEQSYVEHMKTLNVIRSLYIESLGGIFNLNMDSPMFRLLKFTNDLTGCLLQDGYYFDDFGNVIKNGCIVEFPEIADYSIEMPMPMPMSSHS